MHLIIEHLEPEMYPWCILEYEHISLRWGKENVVITNVPKKDHDKLAHIGKVEQASILNLADKYTPTCVLDPTAEKILAPKDAKEIRYFVVGGILGDHPMKGRTEKHFKSFIGERRSLGNKQMSTDTASIVALKIIKEQIPFEKLEFQDGIEIPLEEGFSNVFPYRYLIEEGKIVLTPGLIDLLKKEGEHEDEYGK